MLDTSHVPQLTGQDFTALQQEDESDYTYLPTTEQLLRAVTEEPLIQKQPTEKSFAAAQRTGVFGNIFFGTGLSNPRFLTCGIPFDMLLMPLVAEKIRRRMEGIQCHIFHLIADSHALTNQFSLTSVNKVAGFVHDRMLHITSRLGLPHYHILMASQIATDRRHQALTALLENRLSPSPYAKMQAIDTEYFRITRRAGIKLGWVLGGGNGKQDEVHFDNYHRQVFGNHMVSVYTHSGKRFDTEKPNAVPYTLFEPDIGSRIVINRAEDVARKVALARCSEQVKGSHRRFYENMVKLYEQVVAPLPAGSCTWEKMNFIIEKITT